MNGNMGCKGLTRMGESCRVKIKDGKEYCWRHDKNYVPKKRTTLSRRKELEVKIFELNEEIKHLNSMIEGMRMMKV
jgi:hypothetical protein